MISELLFDDLRAAGLDDWATQLPAELEQRFSNKRYGDFDRWLAAFESLPDIRAEQVDLNRGALLIGAREEINDHTRQQIETALRGLHPWRKGPFSVFGVHVDTEWRSDWKWSRLEPHLGDLGGKTVLDVGCGNGYYALRMAGLGAKCVIGVDPTLLYAMQHLAMERFIPPSHSYVLPFTLEEVPRNQQAFDLVFSMGVLYHRRSPFDHLIMLKEQLKPGGRLVLETLIIPGERGQVLVPDERYARMRNVWFFPSVPELEHWLERVGFTEVRTVDITRTTVEEQRSTDWMQFESLPESLDPDNHDLTLEGYPAPTRAIVLARRP